MNTVIMLRRSRKPRTPRAKRIALSVRYQDGGTAAGRGPSGILVHLLAGQNDGAQNRDQDQDAGDFERQQVNGEQAAPDFRSGSALEGSKDHWRGRRQDPLDQVSHHPQEQNEQRSTEILAPGPDRDLP